MWSSFLYLGLFCALWLATWGTYRSGLCMNRWCSRLHQISARGELQPHIVEAEENLFEYKQHVLLETIITHTFSLRAKFSLRKTQLTLEYKFSSLTNLGVTPVHCFRQCCEDCKSAREPTNWTHCKRYSAFPKGSVSLSCPLSEAVMRATLMLTSNKHRVIIRTMTNGN